MCATSEGHSESGAPAQPAEPQAERQHEDDMRQFDVRGGEGERAHDPGDDGSPAAGQPAIEQAAKAPAPRPAVPGRPTRRGSRRTSPARGQPPSPPSCPAGSRPIWLTAHRQHRWCPGCRARCGRQPARRSRAPAGRPAHRRHGDERPRSGRRRRRRRCSVSMPRSCVAARRPAPEASGTTARKIASAHPRMGLNPFGSMGYCRPPSLLTPARQALYPGRSIGRADFYRFPFGELR